MALDDFVIARVRFEPERKGIAYDGNDADDFVRQNVKRHPGEKNLRHAEPKRLNQCEGGDERRARVADSWNEADQRIEPETEVSARNTDDFIHDEREPFEERLQAATFLFLLRRENFPIDVENFRFSIFDFR